jgi:cysteine desulfurase/selenocysteine lyase
MSVTRHEAAVVFSDGRTDLRPDFPVLSRTVDGIALNYLDSAATSLKPQAVIDAIVHYYTRVGGNIHRGKHMLSEEASHAFESARVHAARMLGVRAHEVIFTAGTTHGINLVALGLGLCAEDLVLVSSDSHHSHQLPWRHHARVEWIGAGHDGLVDLDQYAQLLRGRPAVVALTHCSNVTGRHAPIAEMAALAHEAGAAVIVDAAQSAPHQRIDVPALGADALVFSAHKMLGPTGMGVLVLRPPLRDRLRAPMVGGGTVDWVDVDEVRLRNAPHRFEAGTPHIAGAYGLTAAIDYLEQIGWSEVAEHDRRMGRLLSREAARRDYLTVLGSADGERSGLISFAVHGLPDLTDLARVMSDSYGVMCRSGKHCAQPYVDSFGLGQVLRLSAYVYTTEEDVQHAFTALDEAVPLVAPR